MPIYEFYCEDCHTVYSFLARSPNTRKRPACPRCARPRLERRASAFAISSGRAGTETPDDAAQGFDETRMEQVMEQMARDADGLDENDPRQVAGLMRKLFEGSGLRLGPGMEEAIRRMESGEDPDRIEGELGDVLESEGDALFAGAPAGGGRLRALRRKILPPAVDPTLYEL